MTLAQKLCAIEVGAHIRRINDEIAHICAECEKAASKGYGGVTNNLSWERPLSKNEKRGILQYFAAEGIHVKLTKRTFSASWEHK